MNINEQTLVDRILNVPAVLSADWNAPLTVCYDYYIVVFAYRSMMFSFAPLGNPSDLK